MDAIDRKIIDSVQRDGSLTYAEIGAAAGLSASTVNDRLKRLRADGVLRRLTAEVDPAALDLKLLAFVMVVLEPGVSEEGFRAGMLAAPEGLEVAFDAGRMCVSLVEDRAIRVWVRLKPASGFSVSMRKRSSAAVSRSRNFNR